MRLTRVLQGTLILSLVLVYEEAFGDAPYFVLLMGFGIIVTCLGIPPVSTQLPLTRLRHGIAHLGAADYLASSILYYLWPLILLSWLIGCLMGALNGVDTSKIMRNFFGLTLYAMLPILVALRPGISALINVIYVAALAQAFIGATALLLAFPDFSQWQEAITFSDFRTSYSTGFIVLLPVVMAGLACQLHPSLLNTVSLGRPACTLAGSATFTALAMLIVAPVTMSKGFILAELIIVIMAVLYKLYLSMKSPILMGKIVLASMLAVSLAVASFTEALMDLVVASFSIDEPGNAVRREQFAHLVREMTFFGNGLGSSLRSGYSRDEMGYGFELTYVNMVHKLGVFSAFLFVSYFLTIALALKRLASKQHVIESLIALGSMGYLIVGIGNPILLASSSVILHCISIYILAAPHLTPRLLALR